MNLDIQMQEWSGVKLGKAVDGQSSINGQGELIIHAVW